MKTIVILCDGMADYPVPELDGKTPLEVSSHPNMDRIAGKGVFGLARTVPAGMHPGSDNANLSVFGYDPHVYYTGRSPLEAVNMGIELAAEDVAYRCNLVTLSGSENIDECIMHDYSAGEISTEEARQLIEYMDKTFRNDFIELHCGISYRHCLVLRNADTGAKLTPPHDISGKPVFDYLPDGENALYLYSMMRRSYELLKDHPVNKKRVAEGKNPATSCWFWGEGTKPALTSFSDRFGKQGGVISAVDLIKGIGICAGHKLCEVEGATGNWDTNFAGKADAALSLLENGCDYVYIHVEAPDECGHHGDIQHKIGSIEDIDREILGKIIPTLKEKGEDFAILVMPDHPTPISCMTHVSDPVPFILYSSVEKLSPSADCYTEKTAKETGLYVANAAELSEHLINAKI